VDGAEKKKMIKPEWRIKQKNDGGRSNYSTKPLKKQNKSPKGVKPGFI